MLNTTIEKIIDRTENSLVDRLGEKQASINEEEKKLKQLIDNFKDYLRKEVNISDFEIARPEIPTSTIKTKIKDLISIDDDYLKNKIANELLYDGANMLQKIFTLGFYEKPTLVSKSDYDKETRPIRDGYKDKIENSIQRVNESVSDQLKKELDRIIKDINKALDETITTYENIFKDILNNMDNSGKENQSFLDFTSKARMQINELKIIWDRVLGE